MRRGCGGGGGGGGEGEGRCRGEGFTSELTYTILGSIGAAACISCER